MYYFQEGKPTHLVLMFLIARKEQKSKATENNLN